MLAIYCSDQLIRQTLQEEYGKCEQGHQRLEPWIMGFDDGKWVTFIIFTFIFLVIVCELECLCSNFCACTKVHVCWMWGWWFVYKFILYMYVYGLIVSCAFVVTRKCLCGFLWACLYILIELCWIELLVLYMYVCLQITISNSLVWMEPNRETTT